MKNQLDTSLRIRFAGIAILGLFIALAAAAYLSGQQVKRDSELVATDAVPGTIVAHKMRMDMSRSIGWAMVAASALTTQSRDSSLQIAHDADTAFFNAVKQYQTTIKINPAEDRALLEQVTARFVEFCKARLKYEALIIAGNRAGSAAFLERDLVPAYVSAIESAEALLTYNHTNSITYANHIRSSVSHLYWVVALVILLAFFSAVVLVVNYAARRRELKVLEENEEKFSKAFRANPIGIAITELETGFCVEVNESFCRITGYSQREMIGRSSVELGFWSNAKERDRALFQSLLAGETMRDLELQIRTRDGGGKTVIVNAEMIELSGKRCIVSLVQDVTERKRVTEQLEMLKVSVDKHFDAAYWMDADNKFVYVNDSACKAVGYAREELIGQPITLITPTATPRFLEEVWNRLRMTGFFTRESMHRRKDGSQFPIEIVASYVRFEGKEFNCGFARDITERKRTEETVKASERALKEAQHLAHIGSSVWDARTDKTVWSDELYRIVGWVPEIQPPTHQERVKIYTPESFAILDRAVKRSLATGEPYDLQLEIVRPDGEHRQVYARGTSIRDETGVVVGLHGTLQDITELKQLEQKQVELASLVASSNDAIIGKSLTGIITSWNRGAEKIFGYSAAEAVGQPLMMLIPPNRQHEESDVLEMIKRGEAVENYETVRICKDGRQIYISATISPLKDRLGKVVGASKIARDITEQKQADEILREKQSQLIFAMDIAKLAQWEFDVGKNLLTGDEQTFRLLGTTSEQEGGPSMSPEDYIRKFVHPLDADLVAHEVALGIATTDPNFARQFEHRIIRKDGTEGVMMIRSRIVMDAMGRTEKIHGTNQDITDQKRAQSELISKTTLLEAQLDSTLDGILVVDELAKKILQNRRLLQILSVPEDIAGDDNDSNLLQYVMSQTKNPKQFLERVAFLYAHPDEIARDEIALTDGRTLDRYSAPVLDQAGKYYGRIWIFRDITAQRSLEEQFRQSQKMEAIGQLAGGVAHDFNNILAVIMLHAELASQEQDVPVEVAEALKQIRLYSERAASLTRQMLLFSRKQAMQQIDLNLNDTVTDISKMLLRIIGEDLRLQLNLHPTPLWIHADEGMMGQVLMNLSVNARDAMPNGGQILIETGTKSVGNDLAGLPSDVRPGEYVWLRVSDTGEGIPPEILPKIFEPFFTTKETGKGTGLGLATVFGIVKQHRGWIQVDSKSGYGTKFQIYMPSVSTGSSGTTVKAKKATALHGTETILLVEDDASLRAVTRALLEKNGYSVVEASSGAEAVSLWPECRHQVTLVLTDLVMPGGVDGHELMRKLRKERPDLKIIFVSGYSAEFAGLALEMREGENFVQKPYSPDRLLKAIRKCLDSQRE